MAYLDPHKMRGFKDMNDWEVDEVDSYGSDIIRLGNNEEMIYGDRKTKLLMQALEALESTGGLDFAVLKHPELGEIWGKYTEERKRARKKADALKKLKSTLSKEEMKLLGISHL